MALMRVKLKKHRWYPHVLKTRDPLTFSCGWRKFQSVPIFAIAEEEGGDRGAGAESTLRAVKYTPKFGHCHAVFYGPAYAVGTSLIAVNAPITDADTN